MNPIKPKALKRGDTIGIIAPAGPVSCERIELAMDRLHKFGFRTKTYGDIWALARLSGRRRCDSRSGSHGCLCRPGNDSCLARGGYGVVRILQIVDFNVMQNNPKVFIGFSDITECST